MKNLNIIISIAIVVAIGAAVTAYGIVNPDNNIFSSLGYTPEDSGSSGSIDGSEGLTDNGIGTNNSNNEANTGSNQNTGSNNGAGGNGSGSNVGSGGSTSGYGGGMSANEVKRIVNNAQKGTGFHAGTPKWDSKLNLWVVPILDKNGTKHDTVSVNPKTKKTGRD